MKTHKLYIKTPRELAPVFKEIRLHRGKPYFVGGFVRENLIASQNKTTAVIKDYDIEVFRIAPYELEAVLKKFGKVNTVTQAFPVYKLIMDGVEYDFSVPRRDNSTGIGHTNYTSFADPFMSIEEAAERRDFTMNAVYYNQFTQKIIDPFDGMADLESGYLRPIGDHFGEDVLRILRAFQFMSRHNMRYGEDLVAWGIKLKDDYKTLSRERIRDEWLKWAKHSKVPSVGLKFLKEIGWLEFFPEIQAMVGVPQDRLWHPEGDVFIHTCETLDAMAWQCDRDGIEGYTRIKRIFGILCHDFGKATHTWLKPRYGEDMKHWKDIRDWSEEDVLTFQKEHWDEEWRWRSPRHDQSGKEPTIAFMNRLFRTDTQKKQDKIVDEVVTMVVTHMRHIGMTITGPSVRRLSRDVILEDMEAIVNADSNGRPFSPETWEANPVMEKIMIKAENLSVKDTKPTPILTGKHLLKLGFKESPEIGKIILKSFEAQLQGDFDTPDGAIDWVKSNKEKLQVI